MEADGHPKYLKKIGAPNTDYHLWTQGLEDRGDMLPFDSPVMEYKVVLITKSGYRLQLYGIGRYRVVNRENEVAEKFVNKVDALKWLADRNEEAVEEKINDSTGTAGEGKEAA